jgi:hypothetical protein
MSVIQTLLLISIGAPLLAVLALAAVSGVIADRDLDREIEE